MGNCGVIELMSTTVTYNTWEERQALVQENQALGLVMMVDEVRDGIKTMVFDAPPDEGEYVPTRAEILYAKLADDSATLSEVKEFLTIKFAK